MEIVHSFDKDALAVRVYDSRKAMGLAAAADGAALIRRLLAQQDQIRVIFAAAPSQNEFLSALCDAEGIDWSRVTAFHMDEYIGLDPGAPQGFGNFLKTRIFGKLPFREVWYMDGNADDMGRECARYAGLLGQAPIDIVFMGIGENGHIAFNDPPVANFRDPEAVKVVALDGVCRNQQVNDGCFETLDLVPTHAMTLTVPALMSAAYHLCIVPAATKAEAVKATLEGPVATACPASIMRTCKHATLYLDSDSAASLRRVA